MLIAPLATRLRGLYLAIVTLGLVFIGEHIFREWTDLTGGAGVGREAATPELFGYTFNQSSEFLTEDQNLYLLMLVLLLLFALGARNLARSRVGRCVRGGPRPRHGRRDDGDQPAADQDAWRSAISSFYAGCSGALLYTIIGFFEPDVVQPAAVGAVHRDGADRRGRHGQRHDHGRAVHLACCRR